MARLLRQLLVLAILGAATAAAIRALRSSRSGASTGSGTSAPTWPPISEPPLVSASSSSVAPPIAAAPVAVDTNPTWVEPIGRACPDGYPVKAAASGIYHVPGGQFYERAFPERCYTTTHAAEADGYRAAKR
jgi:hypothetical protein